MLIRFIDTSLVHHLRDISLLYLSTSSMANSTYISISAEPNSDTRHNTSAPGSSSSGEGTATSASNSSFVHVPHPHRKSRPSVPGTATAPNTAASSSRSPIRQTDGRASFLNPGDLDGDDVNDDESWAEHGDSWYTPVGSENVFEVNEGILDIEKLVSSGQISAGERAVSTFIRCISSVAEEIQSAQAILVYHHLSIGDHNSAILAAEVAERTQDLKEGLIHGNVGILDRIRTRCLLGQLSIPVHRDHRADYQV